MESRLLLETPQLAICDIRCSSCGSGWSQTELCENWAVVLVRRGCFRRRVDGRESVAEPAVAYVQRPGDEQRIAHPVDGGDACTSIGLSDDLAGAMVDEHIVVAFTDPVVDLEHRLLLRASSEDDAFELEERALLLVWRVLHDARREYSTAARPATAASQKRAVDAVRELIVAQPTIGLLELSKAVAVSPHHLSRIFRRTTGAPISSLRNRVRVRVALERLAEGEPNLARLAAELGFADHAHLGRTIRRETGQTPSELRRLLAA
jgi:AraC-like DNA-binding protein